MDSTLGEKLDNLKSAFERLQLISADDAVVLFVLCAAHQSSCMSCVYHLVLVTDYSITSIIIFVFL